MYGLALVQADRLAHEHHVRSSAHRCFVKVSGDVFRSEEFLDWVTKLAGEKRVVFSIGGGSQINDAFKEKGVAFEKHPKLGRDTTNEGYLVAQKVLEKNKSWLVWQLKRRNAIVDVVFPIINLAGLACHVDGDIMVYNAYWGFESLYVITEPERVEVKKQFFADMPKVTVLSLSEK